MGSTEDIMRQLKKKKRERDMNAKSTSVSDKTEADKETKQEGQKETQASQPAESKKETPPESTDTVKKDSASERVTKGHQAETKEAPAEKQKNQQDDVETKKTESTPDNQETNKQTDRPASTYKPKQSETAENDSKTSSESDTSKTGTNSSSKTRTPEHPPIDYEKPRDSFKDLSVFEKLMFKDLFINQGGEVVYNNDHSKTVAKNLSKGIMEQIIDDLKRNHLGAQVGIGSNRFTIRETNTVFTSPTSLVRYLMLDKIADDNTALQVARQLFLEKHPDGEKAEFNHKDVRTDERDVYAMVLSTKADPERDLVERVEELIRSMDYLEEQSTSANRRILEQTSSSNDVLNGLNIAMSLMVLERLGLTEGSLPRNLEDIRGFTSQDSIVKMSDLISNDIASDVSDRKRTMARDERMRQSNQRNERRSKRGQSPRSSRRSIMR